MTPGVPDPKPKRPPLKIDRAHETFAKSTMRILLALTIGVGGSAAVGHAVGKLAPEMILGKQVSKDELAKMEKELADLIREKDALSPAGKFFRWLGKVGSDPVDWLKHNEGTLRVQIEQAKKLKDLRDVLEFVLYYVFFTIVFTYTAIPGFKLANSSLKSRIERVRSNNIAGVVNENSLKIDDLEELLAGLKSDLDQTNEKNRQLTEKLDLIVADLKSLSGKVDGGSDNDLDVEDKSKANSLLGRLRDLGK